eukprot:TRINITY_DN13109_c0_g1_i1.p1 TRINITY_DN13109_c0_g1~~TRINITY_DN13109_c0_g1_i1.p1  ORF type:complete len:255 (+),score=55.44 TRINITY_DN13109_c0_g1_i1:165-929(+)
MKRTAPDSGGFDIDAELLALEREVQGAAKKPAVIQTQVISAGPVKRGSGPPVPPPPPSVAVTNYGGEQHNARKPSAPAAMSHADAYGVSKLPVRPSVPVQYNAMKQQNARPKEYAMASAGTKWKDDSLHDWPDDDHRIFVGDLGNECNDDLLAQAFSKYSSFQKAKVIRDSRTGKTKGYGFVSFTDVEDFMRALREMNGKYVGNRPVKLRKSTWEKRMSGSEENASKEPWMKTTAFKSRKHVKAVDAPRHRHGR